MLKEIVYDMLNFDVLLVLVKENIYFLEFFYGFILVFKDVGGWFMVCLLGYFIWKEGWKQVNVFVVIFGDIGSVVVNGFLGVEGIYVYVFYLKGKVSEIQEKQFIMLGWNIIVLEVDGMFDDCQVLVKVVFMDQELNEQLLLILVNFINVVCFLLQVFYYFYVYV